MFDKSEVITFLSFFFNIYNFLTSQPTHRGVHNLDNPVIISAFLTEKILKIPWLEKKKRREKVMIFFYLKEFSPQQSNF